MKMTCCPNGHYYDASIYPSCPYCRNMAAQAPIRDVGDFPETEAMGAPKSAPERPAYSPQRSPGRRFEPEEGATVRMSAVDAGNTGSEPVVGWLVCIDGPDKGKDYRIEGGMNFIGRSASQDISITGDNHISREKHARISFFEEKCSFMLYPGEGHGLVILNGEEVFAPARLNKFDLIKLGTTLLMFIPLCGDGFDWSSGIQ